MPEYTDQETTDELDNALTLSGILAPFAAAKWPSAHGALVAGAGLGGLKLGNMLGHYIDGRNGLGVDPNTGRELDVFDVAADKGVKAEDWVESKLGSKEGDGSFGDYLGGAAGGATAATLSIGGSIYEGGKDVVTEIGSWF